MKICLMMVLFFLSACSETSETKAPQKQEDFIKLKREYWVCTSAHVWYHSARSGIKGMSGTPAYETVECDQWSAKFTDGALGGGAKESPISNQIEKR